MNTVIKHAGALQNTKGLKMGFLKKRIEHSY